MSQTQVARADRLCQPPREHYAFHEIAGLQQPLDYGDQLVRSFRVAVSQLQER